MRKFLRGRIVIAVTAVALVGVAGGCHKKMDMKPYADRVEAAAAKAEAAAAQAADAAQRASAAASRAEAAAAKVESRYSAGYKK